MMFAKSLRHSTRHALASYRQASRVPDVSSRLGSQDELRLTIRRFHAFRKAFAAGTPSPLKAGYSVLR